MMAAMRRWVLVAWLGACGPVGYVSQTTMDAQRAVDAARAAGADKLSPYWWTRATQYLHMSREVAAHADFQGANRFGRLAAEAANRARTEALTEAMTPDAPAKPENSEKSDKSESSDKNDKTELAPPKETP
jgi:hypothetical protein